MNNGEVRRRCTVPGGACLFLLPLRYARKGVLHHGRQPILHYEQREFFIPLVRAVFMTSAGEYFTKSTRARRARSLPNPANAG